MNFWQRRGKFAKRLRPAARISLRLPLSKLARIPKTSLVGGFVGGKQPDYKSGDECRGGF
jgi:hypothetical protein